MGDVMKDIRHSFADLDRAVRHLRYAAEDLDAEGKEADVLWEAVDDCEPAVQALRVWLDTAEALP